MVSLVVTGQRYTVRSTVRGSPLSTHSTLLVRGRWHTRVLVRKRSHTRVLVAVCGWMSSFVLTFKSLSILRSSTCPFSLEI